MEQNKKEKPNFYYNALNLFLTSVLLFTLFSIAQRRKKTKELSRKRYEQIKRNNNE